MRPAGSSNHLILLGRHSRADARLAWDQGYPTIPALQGFYFIEDCLKTSFTSLR